MTLGNRHTCAATTEALPPQSSPGPVVAKPPRLPGGFRECAGAWAGDIASPAPFKRFAGRQTQAVKSTGHAPDVNLLSARSHAIKTSPSSPSRALTTPLKVAEESC
jgi:hypothetical protein